MLLGEFDCFDERVSNCWKSLEESLMFITHDHLKDVLESRGRPTREKEVDTDTLAEQDFCPEQSYEQILHQNLTESKIKAEESVIPYLKPFGKINDSIFLKSMLPDSNSDTSVHTKSLGKLDGEKCILFPYKIDSNCNTARRSPFTKGSLESMTISKENMFTFDDIGYDNHESQACVSDIPIDATVTPSTVEHRRCKKKLAERAVAHSKNQDTAENWNPLASDMTSHNHKIMSTDNIVKLASRESVNLPVIDQFQNCKYDQISFTKFSNLNSSFATKSFISLESIVTNNQTRQKLLSNELDLVVVYDDGEEQVNDQRDAITEPGWEMFSEKMVLVMNTLCFSLPQEQRSKLRCLRGGYSAFSKCYPHLIEKQEVDIKQFSPPSSLTNNFSLERDRIKWSAHDDKGDPTEILPWLFLGSAYHADQTDRLHALGVTALLNVASSEKAKEEHSTLSSAFHHAYIPVVDSLTSEIGCHFDSAIAFIEKVHQDEGKVLVHCSAGVSRSPAVCLAYLISFFKYTLEEAYEFLRSKRTCIAPNLNFMRQLQEFETRHFTDSSISGSEKSENKDVMGSKGQAKSNSFECFIHQDANPVASNDAMEKIKFIIKTQEHFKSVHERRKSKFMLLLASLYMENGSRSGSLRIKINKMLQWLARSYHGESPKRLMSFLMSSVESYHSKSSLLRFLKTSVTLMNSEAQALSLSDIERPLDLLCFNATRRSNKTLSMMSRDLLSGIKTFKCGGKKEKERPGCSGVVRSLVENSLCNSSVLGGEAADNFIAVNPVDITGNNLADYAVDIGNGPSHKMSHAASNLQGLSQHKTRLFAEASNEISSPSKRARPSSLINQHRTMLQPWQHNNVYTFQATLPYSIDLLPLEFSHPSDHRQPQKFPLVTSSLGSLQQSFESNSSPAECIEAHSHPPVSSTTTIQNLHLGSRKLIVSLLTPTCNHEAAFSFEPCQTTATMGGLMTSPTIGHSPLLSPS